MRPITGQGEARLKRMREEAMKLPPTRTLQDSVNHSRAPRPITRQLSIKPSAVEAKILGFVDGQIVFERETPPDEVMRLPEALRRARLRRYQHRAYASGDLYPLLVNRVGDKVLLDIRMDPKGFSYIVGVSNVRR